MKRLTFIFLWTLLPFEGMYAQDALLFEIPFKLPTEVNSEAEEAAIFVSPDGGTMYFSRIMYGGNTGGVKGGQDIWSCASDGKGGWYLAEHNLLTLNNKGNNGVIGISEDGSMMWLINKYAGKKTSLGVSFVTKEGDGWSEPTTLDIPGLVVNSNFYGFNMDPTGMFLIISMNSKGTLGQEDLYVSKNEGGTWSSPIHLGDVINSEGYEITPFLTSDTKGMYFSTDARDGHGGADIYKSERLDDTWTNWSEPVNMGESINSAGYDAYFSLSRDNRIFFCSNRSGMLSDIFESKVLEHLVIKDNEASDGLTAVVVEETEAMATTEPIVEETVAVVEEEITPPLETSDANVNEETLELEAPSLATNEEEPASETDAMLEEAVAEALGEPEATEEVVVEVVEETIEENIVAESVAVEESVPEIEEAAVVEEVVPEEVISEVAISEEVVEEPASEPSESTEVEVEPENREMASNTTEATVEVTNPEETPVVEEPEPEVIEEVAVVEEPEEEEIVEPEVVVEEPVVEEQPTLEVPTLAAEPEPEPEPEPVVVEPQPVVNEAPLVSEVSARREVSSAGYVYFAHNSSYFSTEEAKKLKEIYNKLGGQPGLKLEVLGYSDNLGEEFYNMWISERRANRVIQYLVEKGIDESRMSSKWFGEANQASRCDDCSDKQHQDNRRVELILQ